MKIKSVTYRMNNPQPGYKTEHAEVCIELDAHETAAEGFERAKSECKKALGLDMTEEQIVEDEQTLARARRAGLR